MRSAAPHSEPLFGSVPVLSEPEIDRIFNGALHVLRHIGVEFGDSAAVEALTSAGASAVGNRVRFEPELVRSYLALLPVQCDLGARDPERAIQMGGHRFVTTNGFGTMKIVEWDAHEARPSTVLDLARLTRMADQLDEVGYCQHQTTPQDAPPEMLDIVQAFAVLTNTSKHCHLSTYSAERIEAVLELGRIASDGAAGPVFSLGCCSLSPLRYPAESTQVLRQAVQGDIPFIVVCGAVAGVTSPVTLAGTLVMQTAEHMAAIVLAQTLRPGAKILLGSFSSPMDPRSGMQRLAAAELSLVNGATAQLSQRMGAPLGYGTGGVSDARVPDVQAGIEKAFTTLSCALAGVEVIHDGVSGILDSGRTTSYEQMIVDAEMCRMVRRYVRGIEVNDETLALEEIAACGVTGEFITSDFTMQNFRKEIHCSDLWDDDDDGDVLQRAHEEVRTLLSKAARGPGLSEEQVDAMRDVCLRSGIQEGLLRPMIAEIGSKG